MMFWDRGPRYDEVLRDFQGAPGEFAVTRVADSVLVRVPRGSSSDQVTAYLTTLGFVHGTGFNDSRKSFYARSPDGRNFIEARSPYHEPFSVARIFCDRAALHITFAFDQGWRLSGVSATTAVGCI
jgi:hypothetical protein